MKKNKKRNKIKVRRTWDIDPSTKVHSVDTDYNRSRDKNAWRQEVDDILTEDDDFLDDDLYSEEV